MTPIAPHITAFLRERLPIERRAGANTCDAYSYAFLLLFEHASGRHGVSPSELAVEHLDAPDILAFLAHLQTSRGNSPRTRNARLAAIKSFMRFLEHREPSALDQIRRVLAIPFQRTDTPLVPYLSPEECRVLLDSPDPGLRSGVRDRAMLLLALAGGLRVSELVGLRMDDVSFDGRYADVRVRGKGRRERWLKLWKSVADALRVWLSIRGEALAPEFFLNSQDRAMTRAGFEYVLARHVAAAAKDCPSLAKKRVSPHVLRHTCAMNILAATGDIRKVALWLGHAGTQTTEIYLQADPAAKIEALGSMAPPSLRPGKFRPPDKLLAALKGPRYAKP